MHILLTIFRKSSFSAYIEMDADDVELADC